MVLTGREPGPAQIIEDARVAYQQGRKIFVARLSADLSRASKGTALPVVAETIEAIEAEGWRVDMMANAVFGMGFGYENITCLFRRSD
ncbi:hypothetical protein [Nonomuraea sediminis]|uniref:hypothetical protein n=1 Tax=Nonomuraea sediminis TaxID=2835864 RepID=UPI001BDD792E|nr:hypothetical protein [Nonomuraea sediminis]